MKLTFIFQEKKEIYFHRTRVQIKKILK